jgi:hypothetical protein
MHPYGDDNGISPGILSQDLFVSIMNKLSENIQVAEIEAYENTGKKMSLNLRYILITHTFTFLQ